MWVLSVLESETGLKKSLEHGLLRVGLDGIEQLLVHVELGLLALLVDLVFLLLNVKDLALSWLLGLLGLDTVEERILESLRHVDLGDVDLSFGGNHVLLVDATKWATVELERAGEAKGQT